MRIVVNDYSGHPFQVQLSRELARRGHEVLHLFAAFFQTPKGSLDRLPGDPTGFWIEGRSLDRPFPKYSYLRRVPVEIGYGRWAAAKAEAFGAQVVLSSNMPLDAQAALQKGCTRNRIGMVFWQQDIYSTAIDRILRRKLPFAGGLIGTRYIALEARLAREADEVVVITEDFVAPLNRWGVAGERITVIENWAPLGEMPVRPKDNAWARERGLANRKVLLYAGTLGLKHDPSLLLRLAQACAHRPDITVVVVSEGPGADWLTANRGALSFQTLMQLPFQPFAAMPEVLATADALLVILEPDAGVFSVPSKVLTYLCAGRPIVGSMPPENLAARTILREAAGVIAPPGDAEGFVAAALALIDDDERRARMGRAARAHAESAFDIAVICERFETVLSRALYRAGSHTS